MPKKETQKAGLNDNFSLMNIVAVIVLIILIGLGGHFIGKSKSTEITPTVPEIAAVQSIIYDGVDGKKALDLLKEKNEVKIQESSLGSFVTSINGTENSEDHYWMFYINGEIASQGADQYETKNADKIEWRYEQVF